MLGLLSCLDYLFSCLVLLGQPKAEYDAEGVVVGKGCLPARAGRGWGGCLLPGELEHSGWGYRHGARHADLWILAPFTEEG